MNSTKLHIIVASILCQFLIIGIAWRLVHPPVAAVGSGTSETASTHRSTPTPSAPVVGQDPAISTVGFQPLPLPSAAFDGGDAGATNQDYSQLNRSAEARRQTSDLMANPPPVGGNAP